LAAAESTAFVADADAVAAGAKATDVASSVGYLANLA